MAPCIWTGIAIGAGACGAEGGVGIAAIGAVSGTILRCPGLEFGVGTAGCQTSYCGGGCAACAEVLRNMLKIPPLALRLVCEDTEGVTDCREVVGFSDDAVIRMVSSEAVANNFGVESCTAGFKPPAVFSEN